MNKKLIRKMLTAAGGPLQLTPEELKYYSWMNMSPELRRQNRNNRVKAYLSSTPSIGNFWEALLTYIGNRDPKNPHLNTGEVPNPGMRNPKQIIGTVLKAKSIAERSAKISNKIWDKQYLKAINSGNSKRILAVRDLHFKAKSGVNNPYMFLHATDTKFNQFDVDRTGQNFISDLSLRNGKGIYLTLYSKDYEGTPEIIAKNPDLYGDNVMPLRAYFRNPEKTEHTYHIISSPNYDGYIYSGKDIIGEAFIRNPKLLKSAYSITYDNNGNIIPISQRDNFLINDIRYKQGGKMNILEFLKKGSDIHIKKKNRGKFTSYCGGKVTDECIRKAKASGNPTLVKRATFAANARKWKHLNGGILKALLGTNLDVDNLVDTTRKGWGKLPYFGAANNSNTAGLWDLLNYNVTNNPNVITGAPEILPGRVGMLEKEAPTIYNMIVEYGKNIKDGYRGIWNGTSYKNLYDTLRDFFKTGDKNILTLLENWAKKNKDTFVRGNISESIPKGFTKGNEVTTVGKESASEAGLSVRNTKLGNMNNPPTNPSEKIAVEDWNKMNPDNQISSKLPTGRPSYELELDGLKIDIRYLKLALPLLKKLNSPILKVEQRTAKKTAKERYQEKKEIPSKKLIRKDKDARTMEYGDNRISRSGNYRMPRLRREETLKEMREIYPYSKYLKPIDLRLLKLTKGTPAYKKALLDLDALIEQYRKGLISLKRGGAFRIGVNVLDSNPKMSKAASRKVKKHLYGGDINNPNANGGIAFKIWLDNQLKSPGILKLKEEEGKRKLELEQLESALKTNMVQNLLGTAGNFAMNKLGNLLNNKKVDNGSPSSTINFWNTPTIKNALVTGDFWNNPTIANSLA